jgi:Leucine-rich repeat (LRR) protein
LLKKNDLKLEEAEVLRELEELIGKPIPRIGRIEDIKDSTICVGIDGDHITSLRLDGKEFPKRGMKTLRTLPESIGNLTSLRSLFLLNHNLITIPESLGNLTSLRYLSFKSNKLETIPESIGNLKFLEYLILDNNPLKSIPESIGNLSLLKELYLAGTKLTMLPKCIGNLSSLRYLSLENNQLTTLPVSIGNLSLLNTLLLGENRLEVLPETIGNLKSLRVLKLVGNDLTTLPGSFKNLTSLKSLFLWRNKIKKLPYSVIHLTSKSLHTLQWDDSEEPITDKASVEVSPITLRASLMSELKEAIPSHTNGSYLEKLDEEEIKKREEEKRKRIAELERIKQSITEAQIVIAKTRKICLVCRGKLARSMYICPECESFYCKKCSDILTDLENACWVCNTPFDELKPVRMAENNELKVKVKKKQEQEKLRKKREKK